MERDVARRGGGDATQAHRSADRVVQVVGGIGSPEVQMQATRLTGRLAEVTGAAPVFVPSPGLVGSPALRAGADRRPRVSERPEAWSELTVRLVGIGTLQPSPLLRRSGNSLARRPSRTSCARGSGGRRVPALLRRGRRARRVGLRPAHHRHRSGGILRVPRRVGIAGGTEKLEAIERPCAADGSTSSSQTSAWPPCSPLADVLPSAGRGSASTFENKRR